jgi:hypothetical protein
MSTYYEVEMLEMGQTKNGHTTADAEEWVGTQKYWNIWMTERKGDGVIDEMIDLDIPVQMVDLADALLFTCQQHVDQLNKA